MENVDKRTSAGLEAGLDLGVLELAPERAFVLHKDAAYALGRVDGFDEACEFFHDGVVDRLGAAVSAFETAVELLKQAR